MERFGYQAAKQGNAEEMKQEKITAKIEDYVAKLEAEWPFFQAHRDTAQTVSGLAGSEDAFHNIAVAAVLIFLLSALL